MSEVGFQQPVISQQFYILLNPFILNAVEIIQNWCIDLKIFLFTLIFKLETLITLKLENLTQFYKPRLLLIK